MKKTGLVATIASLMMAFLPIKAEKEMLRVIVEFEEPSVIEAWHDLDQPSASSYGEMLRDEQLAFVSNAMAKPNAGVSDIKVLASYVNVMNGIALEIPMEQVDALQQMPGVKQVYEARKYSLPTVIEGSEGFKDIERFGLSGEGMVIGIIDSGLDTDHEAFSKDPAMPRITQQIESASLHAKGKTFKSLKVPFAYDYCGNNGIYSGPDDDVRGGHAHGTHVSGIAAGDGSKAKGIAPQAQIAFFKVFPDSGSYTDDVYIISALEDAVIIRPDVINMSLGEPCGFSHGLHGETSSAYKAYENVASMGIVLCMSAGNDGRFGLEERQNASMVDTATIGSPALYPAPLAVGSQEGDTIVSDNFTVDGKTILYNDYALEERQFFSSIAPGPYVVIPGEGAEKDYEGLDVKGKIVVAGRDGITIEKKQTIAKQAGARALVIYDTQEGVSEIEVVKDGIPCIMVTKANGAILLEAKEKVIRNIRKATVFTNPEAGDISWFSSWGPTGDLEIKPEITGIGGHVYSSLPNQRYGDMSGTSMAAPQVAGMALLCAQSQRENGRKIDSETLVSILMSNAVVAKEDNELSVRVQGAGCASLANALKSNAYLTVDGKRPKIELGMDAGKTGLYDLGFSIHNLSSAPREYAVSVSVLCDAYENGKLGKEMHRLSPNVEKNDVIVAGKSTDVHVRIQLSQEDIAYLAQFDHGDFIEGYVYLVDNENNVLSLPFLAYYGDWKQINAIDAPGSQAVKRPFGILSYMGFREGANGNAYPLAGMNVYDRNASVFDDIDENFVTISAEGLVTNVKKNTGIYALSGAWTRNIEWCGYEIRNHATGELYAQAEQEGQKTRSYGEEAPVLMNASWKARDASGRLLPDGTVLDVTLRARTNIDDAASETSRTMHVTVDSSAPEMVGTAFLEKLEGRKYLLFEARDNMCLAAADLLDESGNVLDRVVFYDPVQGKIHQVSFDVTDKEMDSFVVELHDYTRYTKCYVLSNLSVMDEATALFASAESVEAGKSVELYVQDRDGNAVGPGFFKWRVAGNSSEDTVVCDGILQVAKNEQSKLVTVYAERGKWSSCAKIDVQRYFQVTAAKSDHGTISMSHMGDVLEGTVVSLRAEPVEGYRLDAYTVNGNRIPGYSFVVNENAAVAGEFVLARYDVNVSIEGNGIVEPGGTQSGTMNEGIRYTATPGIGWKLKAVFIDDKEIDANDNSFTVVIGTKTVNVRVVFEEITHQVTVNVSGGGKASPSGSFVAKDNECVRFKLSPDDGYVVEEVRVNSEKADVSDNAFSVTVKEDVIVSITFSKAKHALRISHEGNGSVVPEGTLMVTHGENRRITLKAPEGYVVSKAYVDQKPIDANKGFIDVKVMADMEVKVVFRMLHLEFIHVGGKDYWYENGKRQAVAGDVKNIWDKVYGVERGREIYDPASDGWYWLDCVYNGAKASSKEVWMPYLFQDDLLSGRNPQGKWVRYDSNGKMIKGWYTVAGEEAVALYPEQAGNVYYYDLITGAMCKGTCIIDGFEYHFDETTGVLAK